MLNGNIFELLKNSTAGIFDLSWSTCGKKNCDWAEMSKMCVRPEFSDIDKSSKRDSLSLIPGLLTQMAPKLVRTSFHFPQGSPYVFIKRGSPKLWQISDITFWMSSERIGRHEEISQNTPTFLTGASSFKLWKMCSDWQLLHKLKLQVMQTKAAWFLHSLHTKGRKCALRLPPLCNNSSQSLHRAWSHSIHKKLASLRHHSSHFIFIITQELYVY